MDPDEELLRADQSYSIEQKWAEQSLRGSQVAGLGQVLLSYSGE